MSEPLTKDERQQILAGTGDKYLSGGYALGRYEDTVVALEARVAELTHQRDGYLVSLNVLNPLVPRLEAQVAALTTERDALRTEIAGEYVRGREHEQAARAMVENAHIATLRTRAAEDHLDKAQLREANDFLSRKLASAQADSEKIESTIGAAINMAARLICVHPLKIDTDELDRRSCYDCYASARAKLLPILCGLRAAKAGGDT